MRYDYAAAGFHTFDCLGWPFDSVPAGGGTHLIQDLTMAVSGAAGTAVIAAAKLGLRCQAIGGLGQDMMGDWVQTRLAGFGIDTSAMQRLAGVPTSSSIVLTRADGSRPALQGCDRCLFCAGSGLRFGDRCKGVSPRRRRADGCDGWCAECRPDAPCQSARLHHHGRCLCRVRQIGRASCRERVCYAV